MVICICFVFCNGSVIKKPFANYEGMLKSSKDDVISAVDGFF